MASNDEYQQQRSFKDEYPKRFVLDGKELVTVRDGFGGFCTFIPMPFPSNELVVKAEKESFQLYGKNFKPMYSIEKCFKMQGKFIFTDKE